MKVFLTHNRYHIRGGEDVVFDAENKLLRKNNTEIAEYVVSNEGMTFLDKVKLVFTTYYSKTTMYKVSRRIVRLNIDLVHCHNLFPRLTPAIFDACSTQNVATVMTLHNYRTICPTALLMHDGQPCERSLHESAFWTVPHKVYRNSFVGTLVLAHMIEYHKKKKTWQTKVDRFICLTEFARSKFIESGFPEHKIVVKPNFTEDPGFEPKIEREASCIFVGRLSLEKGIFVLLTAWKHIDYPIKIVGEGDVYNPVSHAIKLLGRKPKDEIFQLLKSCRFIVVPSICYEGFPMAIVEAFACGTPVVCSRLGSMEEIVIDGVTGLHFEAGNAKDLASKVQWMIDNPDKARIMGQNARQEYLAKYTPEKNYEMLMDIYQQAIDEAKE